MIRIVRSAALVALPFFAAACLGDYHSVSCPQLDSGYFITIDSLDGGSRDLAVSEGECSPYCKPTSIFTQACNLVPVDAAAGVYFCRIAAACFAGLTETPETHDEPSAPPR